jgi:hypothetical protein
VSTKTGRNRLLLGLMVLAFVAAGSLGGLTFFYYQEMQTAKPSQHSTAIEKESVSVFFPSEQGGLERKVIDVQKRLSDRAKAETLFRALKEYKCIPDRLRLYDFAVGQNGVLYLNLSKEFIDSATPEREITMTYGIVNSFIESFPSSKSVQLLVEGEPIYTRSGLLYIFEPLQFNRDLLED